MKKIILSCLVLVIGFSSCSKKDSKPSPKGVEGEIVGSWKAISSVNVAYTDNVQISNDSYTFDDQNYLELEFSKDGTMIENASGDGTDALVIRGMDQYPLIGSYKIAGKQIILYNDDQRSIILGYKLNNNQLTLIDTSSYSNGGHNYRGVGRLIFNKQK